MGRRGADTEIAANPEPPRKRNKIAVEVDNVDTIVDINKPLPAGEVLVDVCQKKWRIGKPIGQGSFGEIYLASDDVSKEVTSLNSRYVIKIEPHSNGPLFVEIHCLIRSARHSKIQKWQKDKKMKVLGMPHYIANGSHLLGDTRYRFLVLPRYDYDIEKAITSSSNRLITSRNILILASQIIGILEYLHSQGYTHSDIKSSNLMVGFDGVKFKDTSDKTETEPNQKKSLSRSSKSKIKYASYYYDEDFVLHNYSSCSSGSDYETDDDGAKTTRTKTSKTLRNLKAKKPLKIKRLFNLRKIKSDVNYEDLNSSICSYDSYQELLENNNNSNQDVQSDDSDESEVDHFKEAIQTQSSGHVYLLDFGLASKFLNSDGSHKLFVMDQRKAHDGTLEYSSRDSHIGAHSRRSDLENLGFNILDWMTGNLPWKNKNMLNDPDIVHAVKKNYMNNIKDLLQVCFKSASYPKFIEEFLNYVEKLEFNEKPDYKYCKSLFMNEFVSRGYGSESDMVLNFNPQEPKKINYSKKDSSSVFKNGPPDFLKRNAIAKVYGRENLHNNSWENDLRLNLIREGLSNDGIRKPCVSRNFFVSDADLFSKLKQTLLSHDSPSKKFSPKSLRSTKKNTFKKKKRGKNNRSNIGKFGNFMGSDKQYTWAEILAGNPESIIRKIDKDKNNDATTENKKPRSRKVSNASEISVPNAEVNASPNLLKKDFLSKLNPTYAMKEVVANYRRKTLGKVLKTESDECPNEHGYTYAMIRIMRNMEKKEKKEMGVLEKEVKKDCKLIENNRKRQTRSNINKNNIKVLRVEIRDISNCIGKNVKGTNIKVSEMPARKSRGRPKSTINTVEAETPSKGKKCNKAKPKNVKKDKTDTASLEKRQIATRSRVRL